MSNPAKSIRIGTMIQASEGKAPQNIAAIADLGFCLLYTSDAADE